MDKLLLFDCETGGTDPEVHSLLTVTMVKTVKKTWYDAEELNKHTEYVVTDLIDLKIKHENYCVQPEALAINKIDLVKHHMDPAAVTPEEAERIIRDFLVQYSNVNTSQMFQNALHWIPMGWNISFDIEFLEKQIFKKRIKNFGRFTIDVKDLVIAEQCKFTDAKKINFPEDQRISLGTTAKLLNLNTDNIHTGSKDCDLTLSVFNHLMKE